MPKIHLGGEASEEFYPLPILLQLASYGALGLTTPLCTNKKLALFFPYSDSIAHWLTPVACLAEISKQVKREGLSLPELIPDGRVLVDGADYIYKGTETRNGTDLYVLEYAGGKRFIPQSQRFRIQPSVSVRQLAKKGKSLVKSVIDGLLDTQLQGNTSMLRTSVVLVSGINETKEVMAGLKFACEPNDKNSTKIINAFGWAHLTTDGEVKLWGSSGKEEAPVVLVASNLAALDDYLEYNRGDIGLIIIDGASHLRDYIAFQSILSKNIPVTAVFSGKNIDCIKDLKNNNFDFWTWSKDELKILCPESSLKKNSLFYGIERKINSFIDFNVKTVSCSNQKFEEAYRLMEAVKREITEDDHQALQIIENLFSVLVHGTRTLAVSNKLSTEIKSKLLAVEADVRTFQYFIEKEQHRLLSDCTSLLKEGIDLLATNTAKPAEITKLVKQIRQNSKGNICIILGNAGFEEARTLLKSRLSFARNVYFEKSSTLKADNSFEHLIVCGYLKRNHMLDIFDKVGADNITVLGYSYEQDWINSLKRQFEGLFKNTTFLRTFSIFAGAPSDSVLHTTPDAEPASGTHPPINAALEEFELKLHEFRRKRILKSLNDDTEGNKTAAYCITFDRGGFAFLTEHHSVPAVTNLLNGRESIEEIPHKKLKDIHIGDLLLFRESSAQNIIREMADIGLNRQGNTDIRAKANRWRTALKTAYEESDHNLNRLMEKLAEYGCKRNTGTVKNWLFNKNLIAPRDEKDIMAITVAAGDEDLDHRLQEIHSAIAQVRSAHMQASRAIIKKLNAHLARNLSDIDDTGVSFEIEGLGKLFLVRVESVDTEQSNVPFYKVNRLLSLNT